MAKEHELFLKILVRLDKEDVLRGIILIGGWCPLVYKEYFGNPMEISMQRTADLDFLVPNPPRIHKDVDVSLIFNELVHTYKSYRYVISTEGRNLIQ